MPVAASRLLAVACLLGGLASSSPVSAAEEAPKRLSFAGDFRFRLEQDWDSRRADGTEREDRARARVRARLGLTWEPTRHLDFGLRLRTGSEASHQSSHVTVHDFDGNDTGEADVNLDRWYLEARGERAWAWAGRNTFPFWKQNEMFWDDDVTAVGLAGGWTSGSLSVRAAELALPVGMKEFSGRLSALQGVYARAASGPDWTLAVGYYVFDADRGDSDAARLRNGNGLRDYAIAVASAQARLEAAGRPLALGVDLLRNTESYGPDDPFAFTHRHATDGAVLAASWGKADATGDWSLGYWYGRIETLAVNASYAQDDWVRWGSATETDGSDLRGHELRFVYGLGKAGNLTTRLYLVEAISSVQDGRRIRVDYNVGF